MRFKAKIVSQPTTPDAGIIVTLPNGGALPGPFPSATVIDSAGHQVHSECLWNNPQEGYAIVLSSSAAAGPLWIYLSGSPAPTNPWTPASTLHPSLLLYTRVGHSSMSAARNLAAESPPARGVRMGQVPFIADSHNLFGSSDNYVSYYTGWINIPESGDIFLGTISEDGSTVLIDGATAADWPGMHSFRDGLTGRMGNTLPLAKGPHRIQYFQFFQSPPDGKPMAELIWRLPSMGRDALPRVPRKDNFLHSGRARITSAETRSGLPPAVFDLRPLSYMDFADQFVDLFEFSLPLSDQYKDCAIDWAFSDGFHAHGPLVLWPVIRGTPPSVTLTISGNHGASSGTRLVYPDTLPRGASVNNPIARRDYAQALLNRLLGAPPRSSPSNPASNWPPAFWAILPQIVQGGGEARDLLAFLFQHCSAGLASLSLDDRTRLGGIYYDELKEDKTTALAVLKTVAAAEKDPAAQFLWQLKVVDFLLFEAGDIPAARHAAQSLRIDTFHGGKHDAELQLIALGDVERMAANIDAATRYYTTAQALYKKTARPPVAAFAGFSDPDPNPAPPSKDGIVITAADTQDADWRKRAVLQNSYYTQVKNLLDQDELGDARDKLDAWQIEFPLSKLEGDYTLAESEYAIKFADFNRAQRILKTYRLRVDLSAQLAEVMQLEWTCDAALQRPADIKELATDIKKRFPDLPLATEADKALHGDLPQPNSP